MALNTNAQKVFTYQNENCVELYTVDDRVGEYLVYLVYDEWENKLDEIDVIVLKQWENLTYFERSNWTEKWSLLGKRIESLRPIGYDNEGNAIYRTSYVYYQPFL